MPHMINDIQVDLPLAMGQCVALPKQASCSEVEEKDVTSCWSAMMTYNELTT
jgi:hypothetical protein